MLALLAQSYPPSPDGSPVSPSPTAFTGAHDLNGLLIAIGVLLVLAVLAAYVGRKRQAAFERHD
jgi:LPXTG-motif cell wall-anchored protein